MRLDLFAGIPVSDYARSLAWYERLLGSSPTFLATPTEAVWELAEHRNAYIEEHSGGVGHALITIFIDDFDEQLASIAARGLEPEQFETYDNGVRKVTSVTQTVTRSASEGVLCVLVHRVCAYRAAPTAEHDRRLRGGLRRCLDVDWDQVSTATIPDATRRVLETTPTLPRAVRLEYPTSATSRC